MALSDSAQAKLDEILRNRMKDAFEVPEALDAILAASEEASGRPYELSESVVSDARVRVDRLEADDGTPCYLIVPHNVAASAGTEGSEDSGRLVVFYHGGGFVMQIGQEHWEPCIQLAERAGAQVLVPIYPLLPKAGHQEAYASAMAAYRLALGLAPSERIALAGDSAGGHLALGVAQLALSEGLPAPGLVVAASPLVDVPGELDVAAALDEADPMLGVAGIARISQMWGREAAKEAAFPPCLLYGPLEGLPPLRLYVGSREVLRPGVEAMAAAAVEAGVDVHLEVGEGLWHCYAIMLDFDEGRAAFDGIVEAVKAL